MRKKKAYHISKEERKKLGRKLSPEIRERIKEEIKLKERKMSVKLPDFRIITTKGKDIVYHGRGFHFSKVTSREGKTRKEINIRSLPFHPSGMIGIVEGRFRDHEQLFEMGLPITKPLRLRITKNRKKIIWEEKTYGDSLEKIIPYIKTKKELFDIIDAYEKAISIFAEKRISAFDLGSHNALFDPKRKEIRFTDIMMPTEIERNHIPKQMKGLRLFILSRNPELMELPGVKEKLEKIIRKYEK